MRDWATHVLDLLVCVLSFRVEEGVVALGSRGEVFVDRVTGVVRRASDERGSARLAHSAQAQ